MLGNMAANKATNNRPLSLSSLWMFVLKLGTALGLQIFYIRFQVFLSIRQSREKMQWTNATNALILIL